MNKAIQLSKESKKFNIPPEVSRITKTLKNAGFEAFLVGGCVRDLVLKKKPKDWDITTNATPEQIIPLFEKTFYENDYGTVGIVNENVSDETLHIVEVTPYRIEAGYSDKRRPDSVTFSTKLEDDLKRRDFTINALAYDEEDSKLIDLYDGKKDLKDKMIKAVGKAEERFQEDGLRILRAVRLHAELGFKIDSETEKAIKNNASILAHIAKERIRDEFIRIIMSDNPKEGLETAQKMGVLAFITPELEKALGVSQNQAHSYDVWTHLLLSLQHSANKKFPVQVRFSALFHDIAKPNARRWSEEKKDWTFHGHEVLGARTAEKIMNDLKFPKELAQKVVKLVRWHMFFSDTEQISLSATRRMVANVGKENIWDLMDVRACDRIGTGRPKENPYRLRKYKSMLEQVMTDPISLSMLKIDGKKIMEVTKIEPGPKIGYILHALLEEVFENPNLNTEENLQKKAVELALLPENELKKMGEEGKEKKEKEEEKQIKEIRDKYHVE